METTNKDFISTTGRLLGKLGPITRLIDQVSDRLLPKTTARASGYSVPCYSYCGAYCTHGEFQLLFSVMSDAETGSCTSGTWVQAMGCEC